ncbi:hypothetical protein NLJ89_g11006 [Agrocybe chaxingu]|uniref:Uncharacterized protein n=1 Tax=Agrocybe chaxingu TaxID=84603 RepID=A0A9W8MQD5_9AGAR|nr:hypothetical protein NLJ89_g11006 [Agrocybe chaxingu]
MTYLQHRNAAAHRLIIARQETGLPGGVDPDPGSGDDGNGGNDGGNGGGNGGRQWQPEPTSHLFLHHSASTPPPLLRAAPPNHPGPLPALPRLREAAQPAAAAAAVALPPPPPLLPPVLRRTTTTAVAGLVNTATNTRQTSSFRSVTPTDVDNAGSTVSASAVPEATSGVSTGSIVGGVVGAIAGIALFGFLIMFFLRKWSASAAMLPATSPTSAPSGVPPSYLTSRVPNTPDMGRTPGTTTSRLRSPAPSVPTWQATAQPALTTATPPSQALAAANNTTATTSPLQERPKYVYGQDPTAATTGNDAAVEDDLSDHAHGAYSSQPQVQAAYNPEAYGSYAKYEDGTATGTAVTTGGYQDATREYQAQGGYAVSGNVYDQQAYYDQSAYAQGGYDPQTYIAQGGYAQQAYAAGYDQTGYATGYAQGGYEQQGQQQQQQTGYAQTAEGYQAPHPYTTQDTAASKHAAAYGGM